MTNNLGKNSTYWLDKLVQNGLTLAKTVFIDDSDVTDPIAFLKLLATQYWSNFDKTGRINIENLELFLPAWLVFVLPRRPATVLYSLWYEKLQEKNQNFGDYLGLTSPIPINNYLRNQLFVFQLVKPFRKLVGLKINYGYTQTTLQSFPDNIIKELTSFSSPPLIFKQIYEKTKNSSFQAGISLLRTIEDLAGDVSNETAEYKISSAINDFSSNVSKINLFVIPTKDLEILMTQEDIKNLKETDLTPYMEIKEQRTPTRFTSKEKKVTTKILSPKERMQRKYKEDLRTFSSWDKIKKKKLRSTSGIKLNLYLCKWKGYTIIASEAKPPGRSWKREPKYYKWFKDPEKGEKYYEKKVEEKYSRGYRNRFW